MLTLILVITAAIWIVFSLAHLTFSVRNNLQNPKFFKATNTPNDWSYSYRQGNGILSIPSQTAYDFILERKGFRLRPDASFTDQCRVVGDQPDFRAAFEQNEKLRQVILSLFKRGVTSIHNTSGRLRVDVKTSDLMKYWHADKNISPDTISAQMVEDLKTIDQILLGVIPPGTQKVEPSARRAKGLWEIYSILAIMGLLGFFVGGFHQLLEEAFYRLAEDTFILTLVLTVLACLGVWYVFQKSSYLFDELKTVCLMGSLCIWTFLGGCGHFADIIFDSSTSKSVRFIVTAKHEYHGRRGNHYTLFVTPPRQRLRVDKMTHDRARKGDTVEITKHPGYLGYSWVENLKLIPRDW